MDGRKLVLKEFGVEDTEKKKKRRKRSRNRSDHDAKQQRPGEDTQGRAGSLGLIT